MKKTITLNIQNDKATLKPECYGCGYLNSKADTFYRCKVSGSCPACPPKKKEDSQDSLLSYPIGTMVIVTKPGTQVNKGKPEVITAVKFTTNGCFLMYSVGGCAWFVHDELVFVSLPSSKSLKKVSRLLLDEEDEDSES